MRFRILFLTILLGVLFSSCSGLSQSVPETEGGAPMLQKRTASLGIVGDTSDVSTQTTYGIVLMGGSRDVESALKWMIERSGGGDAVIIRASGTDAYNEYIYEMGGINSVETLKIDSRELANDPETERKLRNAEMLFIAGGDQSNYMNYWRDTKTMDAINYLLHTKKIPVGGTSAGCAVLGNYYFSGENGSAVSETVLSDPYDHTVMLYNNDFMQAPFLENVITDQHFSQRNREGRLVVFLARIIKEWNIFPTGIGVDERTAVAIDENGVAKVFGENNAYFIKTHPDKKPQILEPDIPLQWDHTGEALEVYQIQGSTTGNGAFNVKDFGRDSALGGEWLWWAVQENEIQINLN